MCRLWLDWDDFLLMFDVMDFIVSFVDIVLDGYLDLGHHQIETITQCLVADCLLLDAGNQFTEILVLCADVNFVLYKLYPLFECLTDKARY